MIKKFEVGKYYRYTGSKREERNDPVLDWNYEGEMDIVLDGKPHQCIYTDNPKWAQFEGQEPGWGSPSWRYELGFENFEEVSMEEVNG